MKKCKLTILIFFVINILNTYQSDAINLSGKRGPEDFADLVAPLLPSVVNISTTTEVKRDRRMEMIPQLPPGTPLEEFFKQFMEENQPSRPRKGMSLGSGFLVSQEGNFAYVVTCNHVIADADEIKVILHDDPIEYKAEIVGRDPRTDLALLKIKISKKVTVVEWGDSTKSRVGEWIIAIGNPFGLSSTVTQGIISTIARDIGARSRLGSADYVSGYLQTDASINMGNSGGPMFNMDGKMIAISTAIFSPNGGNIGIGFGIPSSIAQKVIEQLKEFGRTKRGWIGVKIQPEMDKNMAESFGLKEPKGALVSDVTKGAPSEKAGLKSGDIILKFNNKDVADSRQLQHAVGESVIGSTVPMVVWRNGKQVKLDITIGEFEKAEEEGYINTDREEPKSKEKSEKILGLGLREDHKGVIITSVESGSDAEMKGIRPGDVIVRLIAEPSQMDVKTPGDVKKFVANLIKEKKNQVVLLVHSGGSSIYVSVSLEEQQAAEK